MPIFETIFKELNKAEIRYVVVGGLATVLHGHARLTADVDLMVDLTSQHAQKVIDTLLDMGFQPQMPVRAKDFADPQIREQWRTEKGMQVFSMTDPQNPMRIVDLFVQDLIPFEDLWSRAEKIELTETSVRIASIKDLIYLKQLAGRPQDLDDIAHLEQIQKLKNQKDHE